MNNNLTGQQACIMKDREQQNDGDQYVEKPVKCIITLYTMHHQICKSDTDHIAMQRTVSGPYQGDQNIVHQFTSGFEG